MLHCHSACQCASQEKALDKKFALEAPIEHSQTPPGLAIAESTALDPKFGISGKAILCMDFVLFCGRALPNLLQMSAYEAGYRGFMFFYG